MNFQHTAIRGRLEGISRAIEIPTTEAGDHDESVGRGRNADRIRDRTEDSRRASDEDSSRIGEEGEFLSRLPGGYEESRALAGGHILRASL
jgi:hypothetical protein